MTTTPRTGATKRAAAKVAIAKPDVLSVEISRLRQQIRDIDTAIQSLVADYGTDWCGEGREDVNERLTAVGLSSICDQYAYVAFRMEEGFSYGALLADTPEAKALREGLRAFGLHPAGGSFEGAESYRVDRDGDRL